MNSELPLWEFTVVLHGHSEMTDELSDSVFEALGKDFDCLAGSYSGSCEVDVGCNAATLQQAVRLTIDALAQHEIQVSRVELRADNIARLPEVTNA